MAQAPPTPTSAASPSAPSPSAPAPLGRMPSMSRSTGGRRMSSNVPGGSGSAGININGINNAGGPGSASGSFGSSGTGGGGGSTLLRRPSRATHPPMIPLKPLTHTEALDALRAFLRERSSYDVFPVSFRLIVLDIQLKVKKALDVMLLYGVVSAPLWSTTDAKFAGMFTVQDVIHLIQYYYQSSSWEGAAADVEQFRLQSLRDIERELHVPPPPLTSLHPLRPLFDACKFLIQTHARRLPLIDKDTQTGDEVVVSVLTQYRVLKFIATNCRDITQYLSSGVKDLGIGSYVKPTADNPFYPIATATLQTTVFDVVHMFSELGVSAVPIVDENGKVINLYETVDVITLVRLGAYQSLDFTIAQALKQRSLDFPGVVTCNPNDSLGAIFSLIKIRRVHRLVVVQGQNDPQPGRLVGVISLSDIMRHLIGDDIKIKSSGVERPVDVVLEETHDELAEASQDDLTAPPTGTAATASPLAGSELEAVKEAETERSSESTSIAGATPTAVEGQTQPGEVQPELAESLPNTEHVEDVAKVEPADSGSTGAEKGDTQASAPSE